MLRMMLSTAALAALVGCAVPVREATPPPAAVPGGGCQAEGVQDALGKTLNTQLADELRRRSGSEAVRVLRPGQAVTMEFNARRLGITVDRASAVTALRCG